MKSSAYYRPCILLMPNAARPVRAIFHRWDRITTLQTVDAAAEEPESYRETLVIGLVEDLDGNAFQVAPENLRFVDGLGRKLWSKFEEVTT